MESAQGNVWLIVCVVISSINRLSRGVALAPLELDVLIKDAADLVAFCERIDRILCVHSIGIRPPNCAAGPPIYGCIDIGSKTSRLCRPFF